MPLVWPPPPPADRPPDKPVFEGGAFEYDNAAKPRMGPRTRAEDDFGSDFDLGHAIVGALGGLVGRAGVIAPRSIDVQERPSRFSLTYAFELVAVAQGKAANRVVNLPMNPDRYEVSENYGAAVTPTAGGVLAEEAGFALREVTVAGSCGLQVKRGWSAGDEAGHAGLIEADGNTLYRELRNLFRLYARFKADPSLAPGAWLMAWHDFRNDDHWIIVPHSFRTPRSTQGIGRLGYPYEVTFTAVADYDSGVKRGVFDDGIFGEIKAGLAKVVAVLNAIAGLIEDAAAFVNGVSAAIRGVINGVVGGVTRILAAANALKSGVQAFMDLPRDLARAIRGLVDQWHQLMGDSDAASPWQPTSPEASRILAGLEVAGRLADQLDALISVREVWSPTWREVAARHGALTVAGDRRLSRSEIAAAPVAADVTATSPTLALTARATPGSPIRARSPARPSEGRHTPSWTGQKPYIVRQGDTLLGIAVREMGDPDAWVDIRDANDLRPPYITPLRLPGTVAPGDALFLPIAGDSPAAVPATGPGLTDPQADEDVLGVDLALRDGDFVVAPGGTDLALASGGDCLVADLDVRLSTPLGGNLVYPACGIPQPIGDANGPGVAAALAVGVRASLLQDRRVASVAELRVTDIGDGQAVEAVVIPRGARGGRVVRRMVA